MKFVTRMVRSIVLIAGAAFGLCFFQSEALAQFTYSLNSDNAGFTVTGYTGNGGNVVISNFFSNLPVTAIADFAFQSATTITSVTIPDNVGYIGHNSFAFCSGTTNVSIGNGVTNIEVNAFYANTHLTNIIVGTGIKSLQDGAFQGNPALISIYFRGNAPTSVVSTVFASDTVTVYVLPGTSGWGSTLAGRPVVVLPGVVIAVQPVSQSVVYGSNAVFSVLATNRDGSITNIGYQWYFTGSNNNIQAQAYAQTVSGFCIAAVVTNGGLGYGKAPNINFVGGGGSGAGGTATVSNGILTGISITNAGSGYTNAPAVVIDPPNGFFYGQTNSTLNITNANESNLGNYSVVVSDTNRSVTSSVVSLTLLFPPGIVTSPVGFVGSLASSNALSVVASGTPPLAYQWMLNGTNISGATGSNYVITNLTLDGTGSYSVQVTNPYGAAVSSSAQVALSPTLISPFAGAVDIWGQDAVFNVGAVGSGTLSYQWFFNGQAIDGATNSSYELSSIQFTNAGSYNVVVSSQYGSVTNATYQVVVNPADVSIGLFAGVIIQGTVGNNYIIQGTTDLANPSSWATLTNITLTSPTQIWNDNSTDVHNPSNLQKYYRVLPGQ